MATDKLYRLKPLDARIPKWNVDTLIERDCPFCRDVNGPLLIRPDQLPIAFCHTCGCWYVARIPSDLDLSKMYDDYFNSHRPSDLSEKAAAMMFAVAHKTAQLDWQLQTLSKILGGLKNKRLVEVGCGLCRFLIMARAEGADVVGCDLSPDACTFAREHLDIVVHQQMLASCSSCIGKADVVVMRDLIEHPAQPLVDIEAAYTMLKRGGCLLIHTPNGGEAGNSLETAIAWVGFRVDLEHLQYLSPHVVNWISQKLDMRIERLVASGFPGLQGIDRLPDMRTFRQAGSLKRIVKRIPSVYTTVRILRAMRTELDGSYQDPRLGSYHLFAVLRKV